MQAIEFTTEITNGSHIEVPPAYARFLKSNQPIRIILLIETDDDTDWNKSVAREFLNGYAEEDAIYDNL